MIDFFGVGRIEPLEDGRFQVRANFPEDNWVYSFILGFGPAVEVVEPPHLRAKIREMAAQIQAIYSDSEGRG